MVPDFPKRVWVETACVKGNLTKGYPADTHVDKFNSVASFLARMYDFHIFASHSISCLNFYKKKMVDNVHHGTLYYQVVAMGLLGDLCTTS